MAIRKVRVMGDEVLNQVCKEVKEVTPRTMMLIEDMCGVGSTAGRRIKKNRGD